MSRELHQGDDAHDRIQVDVILRTIDGNKNTTGVCKQFSIRHR